MLIAPSFSIIVLLVSYLPLTNRFSMLIAPSFSIIVLLVSYLPLTSRFLVLVASSSSIIILPHFVPRVSKIISPVKWPSSDMQIPGPSGRIRCRISWYARYGTSTVLVLMKLKTEIENFQSEFPECLESVKITMGHQNVDSNQFVSSTSRFALGFIAFYVVQRSADYWISPGAVPVRGGWPWPARAAQHSAAFAACWCVCVRCLVSARAGHSSRLGGLLHGAHATQAQF